MSVSVSASVSVSVSVRDSRNLEELMHVLGVGAVVQVPHATGRAKEYLQNSSTRVITHLQNVLPKQW